MIKIYTAFFLFFLAYNLQGQNHELEINVIDQNSQSKVEFANIFITPCSCGGPTTINGSLIVNLPQNQYQIITSCIGYGNDTTTVVLDQDRQLIVELDAQGYQLESVTVTSQNTQQNIERTVMGVQQLTATKIKTLPTAIGEVDILRSLTMLPGVGSAGEASNGLSVRGGSLDQNLVLLDNAPIYNPTHLFGLFSIFTPDAIGAIDVYRSNMPSQYGGRIASVVDIKVKNPEAEQLVLNGGVSFVSTRLGIETPIIKNKLSVVAAGRVSFNDFIFQRIERLKQTRANFWDGTIKVKYQHNDKNTFFFTGFHSKDFYELDITSQINNITASSNQYDYATYNGTLNWLKTIDDKTFLRTTLVSADYQPRILFPQEESDNKIIYESRIQYKSLQSEWTRTSFDALTFSAGIQGDHITLSPGQLIPGTANEIQAVSLGDEKSLELAVYGNAEWKPNDRLAISIGLRYSQYLLLGAFQEAVYAGPESTEVIRVIDYANGDIVSSYGGPEPRIGVRWKASESTSLKGSYSLTRQYLQNIYNSTTPLPTSRYKNSDPHIKPQVGQTLSFGIFQNLKNNRVSVSAEAYYRIVDNVLDYKPGADFFLQEFIEQDILQGEGRSYGLEFNFEKPEGSINGWFNYTWSRSQREFFAENLANQINNNQVFNSDFDRPHVFNGTINFQANAYNTFSFNFTYQTGRPYSIPNATFVVDNIPIPVFLERNNARLPDYHRLDFSWRIHNISTKQTQRWKGDWILTVYNVYNRNNAFNRYFAGRNLGSAGNAGLGSGALGAYQFSIFNATIVSLAYTFTFK
jgi:hypothetical protein